MQLPISPEQAVWLGIPLGMVFGALLHRGGVTRYDTIVNQFRLRDFTVLQVMLTAIVVGGLGVWALHGAGLAQYQIKPANLLAVLLGAALFGVGMVLYGYCPGTGIAAVATGRIDALVGVAGMLAGGVLYGLGYGWVRDRIESVWAFGKQRLPEVTGVSDGVWYALLAGLAVAVFVLLERRTGSRTGAAEGGARR
jgi:uncharacterized membrane protein YedE/YeeE